MQAVDWADFVVKIGFRVQQIQSFVCFGDADQSADPAVGSIDFVELVEPVAVDIGKKYRHGMTGQHADGVVLAGDLRVGVVDDSVVVVEAADCIVAVMGSHFDCVDQSETDDQMFWIGTAAVIVVDIAGCGAPEMLAKQ